MIQLHIISKHPEVLKEIEDLLINKCYITGATVSNTVSSFKNDKGHIENVNTQLLIGRTKASLFNTIEKLVLEKFGDNMPVIYGLPIVNIDFKHLDKLNKVIVENES